MQCGETHAGRGSRSCFRSSRGSGIGIESHVFASRGCALHLIRPFRGLRPLPERAMDVAAPPYDVLSSDEARVRASGKPWSFLHVSKPEIDLPRGTNPYVSEVYAKGAENLQRMIAAGILCRDS